MKISLISETQHLLFFFCERPQGPQVFTRLEHDEFKHVCCNAVQLDLSMRPHMPLNISTLQRSDNVSLSSGFFHEQSRDDRDRFVEVKWENILDGKCCSTPYIQRVLDRK